MNKLYWRMYQDRDSMDYSSVVITQEQMIQEVEYSDDWDFPVFEPVYMTEEEFNNLEEFEGF